MPYLASFLVAAALSSIHTPSAVPSALLPLSQDVSLGDAQSAAPSTFSDATPSPAWHQGISLGADLNSMANQVAPGVTVGIPISRTVTIVARPMLLGGETSADVDVGGRLEVQLQTPIYMDRVRAYFGAGPQGFYEMRGSERHKRDFSGGWDAGMEFFLSHSFLRSTGKWGPAAAACLAAPGLSSPLVSAHTRD